MTPPDLPTPVRTVIVNWASETLGQMPVAQIPAGLVRVARFTPVKRARLGGAALAQAVESDAGFRAAVAERARADTDTDTGADGDPVRAAAAAHVLRLPTEDALMSAVREMTIAAGSPSETAELVRTVRDLRRQLKQALGERDGASSGRPEGPGDAQDQLDKLRRRLRDQGTRLRQAEEAVRSAGQQSADELARLQSEVVRLTGELTGWRERARSATERADRAQETLGRLREQTGLHRATADRRLDLLLSTVEGAVSGLRLEWDLTGGGVDPADVVAGRMPSAGSIVTAESTGEPSRLNAWLGLPAAHLIVDGYNVSKTGFPELTLAFQRDRLVRLLGVLSARTSAEVTVVFDGAAVAVPAPPGRGVRVLFSPPGVIADDVIRDLVAAEPAGRVVVVVSSDREVADGVRRRGARTANSSVLLALLG
jgi:hypothetical protein